MVTVEVQAGADRFPLVLPGRERWRLDHLFGRHEYGGLPLKLLGTAPTVIDAGANVGVFAAYAKVFYRAGAVHCFEPYLASVDLLRRNVSSFTEVHLHPFGLGRADGELDLHLDPSNSGAHSLIPALVPVSSGTVRVRVRDAGAVWDELGFGEIDVLKVDTEGCEVPILEALGPRLGRVRVVMAEYHTPADRRRIDALLSEHLLFGVVIHSPWRGVVKYVRADLVGATFPG